MITIKGVTITLIVGFVIAGIIIANYNRTLKKRTPGSTKELINTDIVLKDILDEIEIICK